MPKRAGYLMPNIVFANVEKGYIPAINSEIASYFLVGWLEAVPLLLAPDSDYTADDLLDVVEEMFRIYTSNSALKVGIL